MTQRAVGQIELRSADGVKQIDVPHCDLYVTAVAQFHRAITGGQAPAASGVDGYRSLTTALALAQSAATGEHVAVPSQYAQQKSV